MCMVPGFGGMALTEYDNYCISRLFYDICVRNDACKVSVKELVAFRSQARHIGEQKVFLVSTFLCIMYVNVMTNC